MKTVPSAETQNHFGELLDNAQREPSRHSRPVAYMVSNEVERTLVVGVAAHTEKMGAYLNAIGAIRGQGHGGGSARLLADRKADTTKEG